jgi:hypothetical protein
MHEVYESDRSDTRPYSKGSDFFLPMQGVGQGTKFTPGKNRLGSNDSLSIIRAMSTPRYAAMYGLMHRA